MHSASAGVDTTRDFLGRHLILRCVNYCLLVCISKCTERLHSNLSQITLIYVSQDLDIFLPAQLAGDVLSIFFLSLWSQHTYPKNSPPPWRRGLTSITNRFFHKKSSCYFHTKDWKRAAEVTNRFFVKIDLLFSHQIFGKSCENNDSIF